MPKQKGNTVMHGTRGMFGKQVVFKRRGDETYVSAPPQIKEGRRPTPGQLEARERFQAAIGYATEAILDPATKTLYQTKVKRNQSAHNIAMLDAYLAPVVHEITAGGYRGQAGDIITMQAEDDFKVTAVKVSIHSADGALIEKGAAVAGKKSNWIYTVTQANASVAGTKITATAVDLPGNEGSLDVTL